MWKITTLAIQKSPIKGTGLGGFSAAYAEAQKEYFSNDNGSKAEKLVAGSPEYAFNEYLQIFLEQGLLGIILFFLLSFLIIKRGIQNKQVGAIGSFVTLSVFAFASYPYQLWQFPVVWVLLGSVCTSGKIGQHRHLSNHNWKKMMPFIVALGILGYLSISCFSRQRVYNE